AFLERLAGGLDGEIDVGLVPLGDLADGLAGGGVEGGEGLARGAVDPLAADEQRLVLDLGRPGGADPGGGLRGGGHGRGLRGDMVAMGKSIRRGGLSQGGTGVVKDRVGVMGPDAPARAGPCWRVGLVKGLSASPCSSRAPCPLPCGPWTGRWRSPA